MTIWRLENVTVSIRLVFEKIHPKKNFGTSDQANKIQGMKCTMNLNLMDIRKCGYERQSFATNIVAVGTLFPRGDALEKLSVYIKRVPINQLSRIN